MVSYCHSCGANLLENSFYCHRCGVKLVPVVALAGERTVFKCHSCATERPGNSLYCHNCGVELIPLTTCSRCQKPCCLTDSYCRFCGTDISSRAITSYKGFFYVLAKETTPIFTAERTSVVISILALVSQIFPFKLETLRELPVGQPHHLFLFLLLLALSAYNLKIAMVPDVIVLPAMVVGVVVYWIGGGVILDSIWGIIISGVPFFLVESALSRKEIGYSFRVDRFPLPFLRIHVDTPQRGAKSHGPLFINLCCTGGLVVIGHVMDRSRDSFAATVRRGGLRGTCNLVLAIRTKIWADTRAHRGLDVCVNFFCNHGAVSSYHRLGGFTASTSWTRSLSRPAPMDLCGRRSTELTAGLEAHDQSSSRGIGHFFQSFAGF